MNNKHGITIREAYKDYKPPFNVQKNIERLLDGIPKNRLIGLKTIVVTNSQNISKKVRNANIRQEGRSFKAGEARGSYYQKWKNKPAWIELQIDNMLRHYPRFMFHFSLFRDLSISDTLFHEIGHHIHYTQAPEYKPKEKVADKWEKKLGRYYYRHRYWYLIPICIILRIVIKPIYWLVKKGLARKKRVARPS